MEPNDANIAEKYKKKIKIYHLQLVFEALKFGTAKPETKFRQIMEAIENSLDEETVQLAKQGYLLSQESDHEIYISKEFEEWFLACYRLIREDQISREISYHDAQFELSETHKRTRKWCD